MKHSDKIKLKTLHRRVAKLRERLYVESYKTEKLLSRQSSVEDIRDLEVARIRLVMSYSSLEPFDPV